MLQSQQLRHQATEINYLLIKLTAPTRVLLDAGTCVNVSSKTAGVIIALGRAVEVRDAGKQASKKEPEKVAEDVEEDPKPKRKTKKEQ